MINKLNVFSENTYVVAEEWNTNFRVLNQSNEDCATAINDANEQLAFSNGDLSGVYAKVKSEQNSTQIPGLGVTVSAEQEYYKTLSSNQDLQIGIPLGMNGEARIAIYIPDNRSQKPFSIEYSGTQIINYYNATEFVAGYYYIMIYETNGVTMVKLIWTGE